MPVSLLFGVRRAVAGIEIRECGGMLKTRLPTEAESYATTPSYILRLPDKFAMCCAMIKPPPVEQDLRDVRMPGHALTCASDRQDRIEPQPNINHPNARVHR